jgi:SPP1 gp7 family putative phage head morphogenesis protein
VRGRLDHITRRISEARAAGERVSQAWIVEQWRLQGMEQQILAEMRLWVDVAERRITQDQIEAALAGTRDARELLIETLGPSPVGAMSEPALPVVPVQIMAGNLAGGRPLGNLLNALGADVAGVVRSALIQGVALGRNPREIARMAARKAGLPLARALTIARTEMLRAYRSATLETFRANANVVQSWMWHSALDRRTCAVCWAMHGTVHSIDEELESHPSCRCAMLPLTRGWGELGIDGVPETSPKIEPGEAIFARQPASVQRAVLGPGKYRMYQQGELRLADVVGRTRSPVWGGGRRERSLRELRERQAKRPKGR